MTLEQFLSECEWLDREATPGPWHVMHEGYDAGGFLHHAIRACNRSEVCVLNEPPSSESATRTSTASAPEMHNNQDFILHARTALPLLVKMLREIRDGASIPTCSGGQFITLGRMNEIAERVLKEGGR